MSAENIKITEKAKDYLKKKGKLQVVIEFPKTAIDGIDVYISNSVILPSNDVVIDLDSFLGIKILSLSGFKASE